MVDVFLAGVPVRQRSVSLFEQLRHAIVAGRLGPGDRLPTSRELAGDLGLARSTVTAVYGRLIAEGFAEGRPGDGTFVASDAALEPGAGAQPSRRRGARPLPSTTQRADRPIVADLQAVRPDPSWFPLAEWRRCVVAALGQPPPARSDPQGLLELRRALAAWVRRARGVEAGTENVVVTAGAQGAIDLCARTLLAPRDVVAFENPGHVPARSALESLGLRVVPVAVDRDGLDVTRIPARARAVYVTPSHQLPTGGVLGPRRRRDLLRFADRCGALVFEDDYDSELRYVDRPLEPLQRLDTTGRVVYIGSFSKTLSPTLRVGFIVAPDRHVAALTRGRTLIDGTPPHLVQAALAEFIVRRDFERHLRSTRRRARARRDVVLDHLHRLHQAGLIVDPPTCNAGLHVCVELPDHVDAARVVSELRRRGIAIDTTDHHWVGEHAPGLVFGFGLVPTELVDPAMEEVHRVLAEAAKV